MLIIKFALWQLIIVTTFGEQYPYGNVTTDHLTKSRYERGTYHRELTLKVTINGKPKVIDLRPTRQLLANENLPVWISTISTDQPYEKLDDIMKYVGDFSMYHDYRTRSAVIHFHAQDKLYGIVMTRHRIDGIPVKDLHKVYEVSNEIFETQDISKLFRPFHNSHDRKTNVNTCIRPELRVYPELLIAISNDMLRAIERQSRFPRFVATIRHVLIVYNLADLLYRYVESADISLNVAAIVIERTRNKWGFVTKRAISYVNADRINEQVSEHFRQNEEYFPRHSYDYIAYNTRKILISAKILPNLGVSIPAGTKHMFYPHNYRIRFNFAVVDFDTYKHYTTIVHELAHVFTAAHDVTLNWFFNPSCERSIMGAFDMCSSFCLKWSDQTEKQFREFFSSPAHCILLNKPRSLLPPDPRKIMTTQDQCDCYGYKSSYGITDESSDNGCAIGLICVNEDGDPDGNLPYPLDGTPCDHQTKKVCWNEKCVMAEHSLAL